MKFLIQGDYIIAATSSDFLQNANAFFADGICYTKDFDVIEGVTTPKVYQIIEASLPEGKSAGDCMYLDGQIVAKTVDIAAAKLAIWEKIKAKRDGRLIDGGFLCSGHWFHSDLVSRSQFLANALRASEVRANGGDMDAVFHNSDGDVIAIKTMDNGFVPVTANTALTVMPAFELQESKTYKAALMHKAALDASDDPENYDFSAGWPAIYEGA